MFGGKKRKSAEKLTQPKKKKAEELDLPADQAAAARLELLVGSVVSSEEVADSDTLWKCSVDVGEGEPRTIGAALRQAYPDGLAGRKVIVLANTKPRNLAGFKSQGMLVCATLDDTTRLVEVDAAPGTRALFNGLPADPATPNQMNNKKLGRRRKHRIDGRQTRRVGRLRLAADRAVASVDVGDGASVGFPPRERRPSRRRLAEPNADGLEVPPVGHGDAAAAGISAGGRLLWRSVPHGIFDATARRRARRPPTLAPCASPAETRWARCRLRG